MKKFLVISLFYALGTNVHASLKSELLEYRTLLDQLQTKKIKSTTKLFPVMATQSRNAKEKYKLVVHIPVSLFGDHKTCRPGGFDLGFKTVCDGRSASMTLAVGSLMDTKENKLFPTLKAAMKSYLLKEASEWNILEEVTGQKLDFPWKNGCYVQEGGYTQCFRILSHKKNTKSLRFVMFISTRFTALPFFIDLYTNPKDNQDQQSAWMSELFFVIFESSELLKEVNGASSPLQFR